MKFIKQIEQYKNYKLIEQACTGTPDDLQFGYKLAELSFILF